MANYTIGDMIYEHRTARKYSQEELSFGICSTSSLSRIENNAQVPGKRMFDALMQRLGVSESIFTSFISKKEMELYQSIKELKSLLERMELEQAREMLKQLEENRTEWDFLEKQYLLFAKANIICYEDKDMERAMNILIDALHITMPNFKVGDSINKRLLTFDEIAIINSFALIKYDIGEEEIGLQYLYELKLYMEEHIIDLEEKAKKYPMIIYNITTRIGKRERHQEVYEMCEQAISFCVEYNKLAILPYLLNNKACAAAETLRKEEAKILFRQAISLFEVCKKEKLVEQIQKEASERYHIEINI